MKTQFSLILILLLSTTLAAQQSITGSVKDANTGEALPFATIGFEQYRVGTITNENGSFSMTISERLRDKKVTISYIGYKDFTFIPEDIKKTLKVKLEPQVFQFEEVVVRALSAEEYLKRIIKRIPENYMQEPFQTISYYKEDFEENNSPVQRIEAAVLSYQYPYLLDSSNQHQLLHYEKIGSEEIQFMKDRAEKKKKKKQKKAEKNNEEFDEEDFNLIQVGFGGPETILQMDPVRSLEEYMDSTRFKKFRYSWGEPTAYNGRKVEIIKVETKGTVEHQKFTVNIFVDTESLAIIKIDHKGRLIIPLAVRPLLLAFGFSINEASMAHSIKYKNTNDKWYPENSQWEVNLGIKKLHFFKENEESLFHIGQIFSTKSVETLDIVEIEEDKRLDADDDLDDQVYPLENIDWNTVKGD